MELTKIEIKGYKSINSPVTITFSKGLPTVLIGKNGSGKTNVLEALSQIALANSNCYVSGKSGLPNYRAFIQLSQKDVEELLPDIIYDKNKCELVAYSGDDCLKVDRFSSEYIVPELKKEISDTKCLMLDLEEAIEVYRKQIKKISYDGYEKTLLGCYSLHDSSGKLTNYNWIVQNAKWFMDTAQKALDELSNNLGNNNYEYILGTNYVFIREPPKPFKLKFEEPTLASFERKFVSINRTAIKREITKINKATNSTCERINKLIAEIKERTGRIQGCLDNSYMSWRSQEEQYYTFLNNIRGALGHRCLFLKNESRDVIFKTEDRNYYYNDRTDSIIETYLRQVYDGNDRDELLSSMSSLELPEESLKDFENYLNKNLPLFDKGMYDSVSVQMNEAGRISILLNEKTGAKIDLNQTSAGRRWYFTYYFMKSVLEEGDTFIIDEPAAMLHPCAQREVLSELMELAKRGVRVVYSTHCPYLIPDKRQGVHFVTMTEEGTEVSDVSSKQELVSQLNDVVGEDVFDVQIVLEKYFLAPADVVARNISNLIRDTQKKSEIKNLQTACDEIGIKYDTMKSWNRWPTDQNGKKKKKFNSPSLPHTIKVLQWAKKHNNLT